MAQTLMAYVNAHEWAQWAFVAFLFGPPLLASLHPSQRGLTLVSTLIGWFAFLIVLALLLV